MSVNRVLQWEYMTIDLNPLGRNELIAVLNQYGKEGWEYIGPLPTFAEGEVLLKKGRTLEELVQEEEKKKHEQKGEL
jgi:hypothetical protein